MESCTLLADLSDKDIRNQTMKRKLFQALLCILLNFTCVSVYAHKSIVVIPMDSGQGAQVAASERLQNVVTVSKQNGDFTSVGAALRSITDSSESNPYLVFIGPGVYEVPQQLVIPDRVDIVGSGEGMTKLVSKMLGITDSLIEVAGVSRISNLSISGVSTAQYPSSTLISNPSSGVDRSQVFLDSLNLSIVSDSLSRAPIAISLTETQVELDNVSLVASGDNGIGLRFGLFSSATVQDSSLTADTAISFGSDASLSIYNSFIVAVSLNGSSPNSIGIDGLGSFNSDRVVIVGSRIRGRIPIRTNGQSSQFYKVRILSSSLRAARGGQAVSGQSVDKFVCAATVYASTDVILNENCSVPAP